MPVPRNGVMLVGYVASGPANTVQRFVKVQGGKRISYFLNVGHHSLPVFSHFLSLFLTFSECVSVIPICRSSFSSRLLSLSPSVSVLSPSVGHHSLAIFSHFLSLSPSVSVLSPSVGHHSLPVFSHFLSLFLTFSECVSVIPICMSSFSSRLLSLSPSVSVLSPSVCHHSLPVFFHFLRVCQCYPICRSSFSSRLLSLSPSVSVLSPSVGHHSLPVFSHFLRVCQCYPHLYVIILFPSSLTFSKCVSVIPICRSSLSCRLLSLSLTFSECVSVIPICMSSFSSRLLSLSPSVSVLSPSVGHRHHSLPVFSHFLRVCQCYPHLYVIILFPSSLTFSECVSVIPICRSSFSSRLLSLSLSVSVLSPSVGRHSLPVFPHFLSLSPSVSVLSPSVGHHSLPVFSHFLRVTVSVLSPSVCHHSLPVFSHFLRVCQCYPHL